MNDKNNTEIYKGDLVEFAGQIGIIDFEHAAYGIAFKKYV